MTKSLLLSLFLVAVVYLFSASCAEAEPRVALVVGNGNYGPTLDKLVNPKNDAQVVAKSLQKIHFDVQLVIDADQKTLKRAIMQFGVRLRAAGKNSTGFFYYAGHGLEDQGKNYLVPVDAEIHSSADLDLVAVDANSVMNQMESSSSSTNIMVLDACRDTPFARGIGGNRGFVAQYPKAGAFIGYSTAPGATATDGVGKNSPFAKAFASEVMREGAEVNDAYLNIRRSVLAATGNQQVAWDASSLIDKFYFSPSVNDGRPTVVAAAEPSFDRASAGVAVRGISDKSQEGDALRWVDDASQSNLVTVVANRTTFHMGDTVRYLIKSQVDGYVALFSAGPDKRVHVLHPGIYDRSTSVRAGDSKLVPGTAEIIAPFGEESIIAVVTKKPLFNNGYTPLCSGGKVDDVCPGFYERLLDLRKKWSLMDPQTGAGEWAFGAAHYVSKR